MLLDTGEKHCDLTDSDIFKWLTDTLRMEHLGILAGASICSPTIDSDAPHIASILQPPESLAEINELLSKDRTNREARDEWRCR